MTAKHERKDRQSKTSRLLQFLSVFHPKEDIEVDMRGLSKSFDIARSTILGLISRNPTELGRRGHWLIIKQHGARSRTDHNVREEGQPSNSLRSERRAKPDRPKRAGRRTLRSQRGHEDSY